MDFLSFCSWKHITNSNKPSKDDKPSANEVALGHPINPHLAVVIPVEAGGHNVSILYRAHHHGWVELENTEVCQASLQATLQTIPWYPYQKTMEVSKKLCFILCCHGFVEVFLMVDTDVYNL